MRDERGDTAALSRAAPASQRAALILERNRLGYAHGGDRRSWKFADKEWRHGQEYLDKARALQVKIAENGGDQIKRNQFRLKKRRQNLPPKRRPASGPSMTA
jgi:hypothetical protein